MPTPTDPLSFRGHKATIVVELKMDKGAVLRVPLGAYDYEQLSPRLGVLRIPVGGPLMDQLYHAEKEASRDFLL